MVLLLVSLDSMVEPFTSNIGSVVIVFFISTVKINANEIPIVITTGLKAIPKKPFTLNPFSSSCLDISPIHLILLLPIFSRQNINTNSGDNTINIQR